MIQFLIFGWTYPLRKKKTLQDSAMLTLKWTQKHISVLISILNITHLVDFSSRSSIHAPDSPWINIALPYLDFLIKCREWKLYRKDHTRPLHKSASLNKIMQYNSNERFLLPSLSGPRRPYADAFKPTHFTVLVFCSTVSIRAHPLYVHTEQDVCRTETENATMWR